MLNYECKVEVTSPIARELTISVKSESLQKYIDKQYIELQKKIEIKGFRKGRVPLPIIQKYYKDHARADAFSQIIEDSCSKALADHRIQAVGRPEITPTNFPVTESDDFVYKAKVEIYPEINLVDLTKLVITGPSVEVKDEDVEEALQTLQRSNAEVIPNESYEGPAKRNDYVVISFNGSTSGKPHPKLTAQNQLVQIGSGQLLPQFDEALEGMQKGSTKNFDLVFPQTYHQKEFAGKRATFEVTLHEFKKELLPVVDEDFAKRFKVDSLLELRKQVLQALKDEKETQAQEKTRESLIKTLLETHAFEVPAQFIDQQLSHLIKDSKTYLEKNGFTEKMVQDSVEKEKEWLLKRAHEQVRASLILDALAIANQITVEQKDIDFEFEKISKGMRVPIEKVQAAYNNPEMLQELRFKIRTRLTIDYVLSKAQVQKST